ncbi:MAG: TonB-dependent receptor, partial [Bacteroidota bacterium]
RIRNDRDLVLSTSTQLATGTNLDLSGARNTEQTFEEEEDFGLFAQQEINFEDKIIVTGGIRLDKSTLNGDPNRFYAFPKASIAFNLTEFGLFSNTNVVSLLKLRFAWGQTGSSPQFGATFTSLGANSYLGNNTLTIGSQLGQQEIEPETANEFETGVDFALFNNRISVEATYYNRQVNDLILERALPSSSGFTTQFGNFGDLRNQGIEVAVNALIFQKPNFSWSVTWNTWKNVSEITRLDVPAFAPAGSAFGLGLGSFFIEEGATVTQLVATANDGSNLKVGDAEPDFQMGLFNTFTIFKNLEIRFLWHWKQGYEVLNLSRLLTDIGRTTPDFAENGEARSNGEGVDAFAQGYIEDGSYLRLREVAVYYTLPRNFVKNAFGN